MKQNTKNVLAVIAAAMLAMVVEAHDGTENPFPHEWPKHIAIEMNSEVIYPCLRHQWDSFDEGTKEVIRATKLEPCCPNSYVSVTYNEQMEAINTMKRGMWAILKNLASNDHEKDRKKFYDVVLLSCKVEVQS